jgi:hypothetical protein
MEVVLARRAERLVGERATVDRFDQKWCSWSSSENPIGRDGNWRSSIRRFLSAGLDERFLHDAVDATLGNRQVSSRSAWKYFCGICWREIDAIQAETQQAATGNPATPTSQLAAEPFPYMDLFDVFLSSTLKALRANDDVQGLLSGELWSAMSETYGVYYGSSPYSDDWPLDEEEPFSTARDFMLAAIARVMHEVTQLQYPSAGVTDGKE